MRSLHRRLRVVPAFLSALAILTGCTAHSPVSRTKIAVPPLPPVPPAASPAETARVPDKPNAVDLKSLERAAAAKPNDAKVQARYGSALVEAGKGREGTAHLRRAVRLNPKLTAAWHNLGLAAERQGWLDLAADADAHVVAALPNHAGEWVKLGYILLQLGRYAEAERAFQRAAALEPNASEPLVALAASYFTDFHNEQAIAALKRAAALNPRSAAARANLASILLTIDKRTEAEQAIRQAIAIEPDVPRNYLVLGRILADSPRSEARQEAKRALEQALSPGRTAGPTPLDAAGEAEAYHLLGIIARGEGKREEAVADWRRAHTLDPTRPDTLRTLGQALTVRGGAEAAEGRQLLQEYQRAQAIRDKVRALQQRVEEHPQDDAARILYGQLLLEQGNLPRAVWELEEAARLRPHDTDTQRALAEALKRQGRNSQP